MKRLAPKLDLRSNQNLKNEQVHKYQLKAITSYVAPTTSNHNATKVKFKQVSPVLQEFKQDESVTTVTQGRTAIMARCVKYILRQVSKFKWYTVKAGVTSESTKRPTNPIPTINRLNALKFFNTINAATMALQQIES